MTHLFSAAVLLLMAWGIFAFGAEYTWAYAPLLVFSLAVSTLGLLAGSARGLRDYRWLILSLGILFLAGVVQVVPLPGEALAQLSPNRTNADYDTLYRTRAFLEIPAETPPPRTLSIAPNRSVLGLWFLGTFSVLLIGAAIGFGAMRPTTVAKGLMFMGLAAAMVAIVQGSTGVTEMYGFWHTRQFSTGRLGPLGNKNHTAGVLIMLIALTLGYMASCVQRSRSATSASDWRARLLWLETRSGRDTIVAAFAAAIMAVAIFYINSRAAVLCLVVVTTLVSWFVAREQRSRWGRVLAWGLAVFILGVAANAGGIDQVVARLTADNAADRRLEIWEDAVRMARDFPLTGTGLNTFGVATLHYQEPPRSPLFVEAHNEYLQILAEGGLLLTLPALAAVVALVVLIRRRYAAGEDDVRTQWLRTGAVAGMIGIGLQSLFDFTLQMPGAAALFVLLAAIAIHRPEIPAVQSLPGRGR